MISEWLIFFYMFVRMAFEGLIFFFFFIGFGGNRLFKRRTISSQKKQLSFFSGKNWRRFGITFR